MSDYSYLRFTKYSGGYQVGNEKDRVGLQSTPPSWHLKIPSYIDVEGEKQIVNKISCRCFAQITELMSVSLPSTITFIDFNAFFNTKIKKMIIPFSVTTISSSTFNYMHSLETVIFERGIKLESFGKIMFYDCHSLKIVYYCGSTDMSNLEDDYSTLAKNPIVYTLDTYLPPKTFGIINVIRTYT